MSKDMFDQGKTFVLIKFLVKIQPEQKKTQKMAGLFFDISLQKIQITKMDNIKKLETLVLKATSQNTESISQQQLQQILEVVNSRADMPKYVIANISKRMALKNKRVLINVFVLLEFLVYECELSLYSQVSTKEFLFKISGLLMNKDIEAEVRTKIMETIFCCEELFRPHEDLLPLFFHFYAGLLRNGFDIPHGYKSPFRPAQLKQYKKPQAPTQTRKTNSREPSRKIEKVEPSITEKKTFEQIRQKLILTNQIIDNTNPADSVKDNALLMEMIEQIKECERKVNKTINENPNETIMELALAANDDIFITYRRYKDLQRNKKPEPFILTQLASDMERERQVKKTQPIPSNKKTSSPVKTEQPSQKTSSMADFLDFDEPSKKVEKRPSRKQQNLFDMDLHPEPVKKQEPKKTGDIFDLLGDSASNQSNNQPVFQKQPQNNFTFDLLQGQQSQPIPQPVKNSGNPPTMGSFDDLLLTTQFHAVPPPSGNGITLNVNDFSTEADIKNYQNKNVIDKLEDLTAQFLKR